MIGGLVLIFLLKNTSPPPPQEQIHFDNPSDKPLYLTEPEAFKKKCLEFLEKFNLEYEHSVWANDHELEIAMRQGFKIGGQVTHLLLGEIEGWHFSLDPGAHRRWALQERK